MSDRRQLDRNAKYFSLGFWVAVALCIFALWVKG